MDLDKDEAVDFILVACELIQIEVDDTQITLKATGTAKVSLDSSSPLVPLRMDIRALQ